MKFFVTASIILLSLNAFCEHSFFFYTQRDGSEIELSPRSEKPMSWMVDRQDNLVCYNTNSKNFEYCECGTDALVPNGQKAQGHITRYTGNIEEANTGLHESRRQCLDELIKRYQR